MRRLILVLALFVLLNVAWGFTTDQETKSDSNVKSGYADEIAENKTFYTWQVSHNSEYTKIIRGSFDLVANAISISQNNLDLKVRSFLSSNALGFEINPEDLVFSSSYITQKPEDLSILKYVQTYNGLPVYSSKVIVAIKDGKIVTLKSNYYSKIDISTKPTLSEADILDVVERDAGVHIERGSLKLQKTFNIEDLQSQKFENITDKSATEEKTSVEELSLVIYPMYTTAGIEYHLAYKVELGLIESTPAKWVYIVDANNGEVLEKYDKVVFSTLNGQVTGLVYPEHPNQSQVTKGFWNETLYDFSAPISSNVFWSGRGNSLSNFISTKNSISLSGASSAVLKFKTKYFIEKEYDYGSVWVSIDGHNYTYVDAYTGNQTEWTNKTIDLSPFTGRNIYILFLYETDSSVAYDGWYIDDIQVITDSGVVFSDTADSFTNWYNYYNRFSVISDTIGYSTLGYTGSGGNYSLSGLSTTVTLYSKLKGRFVNVDNLNQSEAYHRASISTPSTHSWSWSGEDASYKQEESNMFYHVNTVHDFFTKGSPFDIYSMNYQMIADVQYPGYCNAFSDGTDIHFYRAGGGCEATSLFSDIIYHEYTHSMVAHVYTTYLPYRGESGALNEGWADYFASTINNNSCMAEGFGAACMRNLKDIYIYPENILGQVHYDSRIVAGAMWDLRGMLGVNLSDALIINAMKLEPFNFTEYLEDVITADDDNANLNDGTPNLFNICTAFYKNHGIYSSYCGRYYPVPETVNHLLNPGFESGRVNWTEYSSGGYALVVNNSQLAHNGRWLAFMGGYNNTVEYIYQDVTIPSGASQAYLRFWYWIVTTETTTTTAYDIMKIEITRPEDNTLLRTLGNLSNLNKSYGWVISKKYNVSDLAGQRIRVRFNTTTDSSKQSYFLVDDTSLMTVNETAPVYGISLTVDSPAKNTATNVNATYIMTMINTGNIADTYNLTFENKNNATVVGLSASSVSLNANASANVRLNVTNASAGTFVVNVTAVSQGDTSKKATVTTRTTVTAAGLKGDVNNDGVVNVGDVTYLARHLAEWPGYTVITQRADVNNDGVVNVGDVTYLARHLAEWPGYPI